MYTIRFRTKLLAAFLVIVVLSLATLLTQQLVERKVHELVKRQQATLTLESKVTTLLHKIHELAAGLLMAAADGSRDRGELLASEQTLDELRGELQLADWRGYAIAREDVERCLEIARALAEEVHTSVSLMAELEDRGAATARSSPLGAALHRSLARAEELSSRAEQHAGLITAALQRHAQASVEYSEELARSAALATLGLELLVAGLALVLGITLSRSLSQRLNELSESAAHYGRGDFSRRAEVRGSDEIATLARSFNHMARDLQCKTRLLLSKRYVENILDTMTNGLIVIGEDRAIERVNRATCELVGRDAGELLDTELDGLLGPAANDHRGSPIMDAIMDGSAEKIELTLNARTGAVPVALSSAIMDPDDNAPAKVVCVVEDITERKELIHNLREAKRAAERADKAKSVFLASMSHELRTPLNGVLGYAQILLRDSSLSEQQRDALSTMHASGEHLLTLLNDILDLSKIEAGRMELKTDDFHLPNFIDGIADMFRIRAAQKGIQFLCEKVSEVPVAVRGDQKRLRQILINLLGNAIKFTDQGGVVLKVGMHYGKVRFQVEDTGAGIAREQLQEIFAPFKQVAPRPDDVEGTGLGLAITRRLATMMGSALEVTSEPGKGSTFWLDLELPAIEGWSEREREETPQVIGYEGPRRTLLIADDKEENRSVLRGLLELLGFVLDEVENGQEALDRAAARQPDAILMDLRMPVLDGLEATRRLRRSPGLEHIVVIAVSASAFDENRSQSEAAGCDAFLTKPIRLDALLETLQRHLDLAWVYEKPQRPAPAEPQPQPVVAPPADRVAELYDLARRGDIGGIRAAIARIDALGEVYQPFADRLRTLAKKYQIKQIRELLAAHLP